MGACWRILEERITIVIMSQMGEGASEKEVREDSMSLPERPNQEIIPFRPSSVSTPK